MAQTFDLMSERFQFYTKEKNKVLSSCRGIYVAFIHPISMGMYPKLHAKLRVILDKAGIYFAGQNDMLECYGQREITGKHSSDIQKGKNTWYGKLDLHSHSIILKLYEDLEIFEKFLRYEQESYDHIQYMIDNMSKSIPKELIRRVVDSFYGKI